MKKLLFSIIFILSLSVCFSAQTKEQTINLDEIIKKSYNAFYYAGDDASVKARMMIVDKSGNKQMRQFDVYRKDKSDGGDQDFLVVFERPSDVKGTVFLVNKHINGDDDRWLYLPGLDLEKRISASDKRTSFVGSDYFYEDISGRNYLLDNYTLVEQSDEFYKIQATPKEPKTVEFDHYIISINKKDFFPKEAVYFKNDKAYRKITVLETKLVDGYITITKSKVENLEQGSTTLVQFKKPAYNQQLNDSLFTVRSLRNPPKSIGKK